MPLHINLRHLEEHEQHLEGELPVEDLSLDLNDDIVRVEKPLRYDLEVQTMGHELLVQGELVLPLRCQCVRCLKEFEFPLKLEKWTWLLPLEGEEKIPVVNDSVDLTPFLREDILLEFPQHPLCETDCRGLPNTFIGKVEKPSDAGQTKEQSSAWAALDKLKLKK
jgi:uncharacterized metal-binding protein YceD (DUF177 family)